MTVYIGIDWSEKKHDVCYMHENGEVLRTLVIPHSLDGFVALDQARAELGVTAADCVVGLETAHNLLVDFLWDQGYQRIYILPPKTVKSNRGRYRQSGAKSDAWDARLITDILRTDHRRYIVWQPDSPLTRQIRATVRMLIHIKKELIRNNNRLRAVLLRYYPAAVGLFSHLDSPVSLAFLQAYPTPQKAAALSYADFEGFLRQHHHCQRKTWLQYYNHLQAIYPSASPEIVSIYSLQALTFADILAVLVESESYWNKELTRLYESHPDRAIYASLPGAGQFLEPALLAKMGDDRQRFPTPKMLQAVAGTCPVTESSGKHKTIYCRSACDHEFRHIVQQWAKLSLNDSPWADAYYRSILPHCQSTNDATRRLANRWLEILWRLWQNGKPYDQAFHLSQHTARCKAR